MITLTETEQTTANDGDGCDGIDVTNLIHRIWRRATTILKRCAPRKGTRADSLYTGAMSRRQEQGRVMSKRGEATAKVT